MPLSYLIRRHSDQRFFTGTRSGRHNWSLAKRDAKVYVNKGRLDYVMNKLDKSGHKCFLLKKNSRTA